MIYTLDYIEEEAKKLASSWTGKDTTFYYEGEKYHEDDVSTANEIIEKVEQLRGLLADVRI